MTKKKPKIPIQYNIFHRVNHVIIIILTNKQTVTFSIMFFYCCFEQCFTVIIGSMSEHSELKFKLSLLLGKFEKTFYCFCESLSKVCLINTLY